MINDFVDALISSERSEYLPEEYDYWKDLIGEWDFDFVDNSGRHVEGEWLFSRVLEGIGIEDLWICPSRKTRDTNPQNDAEYGVALRMFNPRTKVWDMIYTYRGGMDRLTGTMEKGNVVLTKQDNPNEKWVFVERTKEKFHWQHVTVLENGDWQVNINIYAHRKTLSKDK